MACQSHATSLSRGLSGLFTADTCEIQTRPALMQRGDAGRSSLMGAMQEPTGEHRARSRECSDGSLYTVHRTIPLPQGKSLFSM